MPSEYACVYWWAWEIILFPDIFNFFFKDEAFCHFLGLSFSWLGLDGDICHCCGSCERWSWNRRMVMSWNLVWVTERTLGIIKPKKTITQEAIWYFYFWSLDFIHREGFNCVLCNFLAMVVSVTSKSCHQTWQDQ